MTVTELIDKCDAVLAQGLTRVILTVPRSRPPKSNKGFVWKGGPPCTYVGQLDDGRWLVDCEAKDVLRAVEKLLPMERTR